jgi:putative restriction endonuclease
MDVGANDWELRSAAFRQVRRLTESQGQLTSADLRAGFTYGGVRYPLINPQRGIFKPRQMDALLSIRTVFPKRGARVWYDDQREVHAQVFAGDEAVDYAFMGTDPKSADNQWLLQAMKGRVPIIYFLGVSPGHYEAIVPCFIVDWDAGRAKARVAFAPPEPQPPIRPPSTADERRYALRLVKQRLHQATFRDALIAAYGGKCALSGLPEPLLLDAAHIVSDSDESLGHPIVPNGLALSKIHHAAFDAHLIGIDPDFRVLVSKRLLAQSDGPMLEAMKSLHKTQLHLPERAKDHPDRERLAIRFEQFTARI